MGWWTICLASLAFAAGVGTWQADAILHFRRPAVDQSLALGERVVIEGVGYGFTGFRSGAELPLDPALRHGADDEDVVAALPGAELVQVLLTVEIEDPGRDPQSIYCDPTLVDPAGRTWRTDSDVGYRVAGPEAITCTGDPERRPEVGVPYEVGVVFEVPADAVPGIRVRVRLSGGQDQHLLELRPR